MKITKYGTLLDEDGMCVMVKEKSMNYHPVSEELNNPEKIYRMLCDVFCHNRQTEEYLYLLYFNTKCRLQGVFEVSHGTVSSTLCNAREIFQKALLCNASCIALAHNHPSMDITPSMEDVGFYRKIKAASELMGVSLLDSIIVGNGYYSFKERMENV